MTKNFRLILFAVSALFIAAYIMSLANHPLLEPDEGRYAEIPREMAESGDYITPRLNYVKYFEKPALLYWMNAASYKIFGENEFASRLPCALAALLGAAVTGMLGARMSGKRAGLLAALVTGSSLLYFAIGTIDLTDMPVSFFITAAAAAFYAGAASGNRRWYAAFYAAMAAAVLTKGLIGIILPGGIAFWYIILTRRWRLIRDALYPPGILIFFAVSVPWFYLVCKANPDFFRFFFIQEHFLRYTTKMHGRYEPFWFYLPMIPAGMMPWTGFFFSLFGRGSVLRSPGSDENRGANIFLLLWFGIILTFFSLSSSKLIPYIVPCVPPLAILIAANMSRMMDENRWIGGALAWSSGILLAFAAALLAFAATNKYVDNFKAVLAALPVAAALSGGAILALMIWRRTRDVKRSAAALCAGAMLFTLGLQTLYIPAAERRSAIELAAIVSAKKLPGETIAVYGEVLQGVPFYTKERVILVNYLGELEYGADNESERDRAHWFPDGAGFLRRWRAGEPLALIIRKKYMETLFGTEAVDELNNDDATEAGDYVIIFNRGAR